MGTCWIHTQPAWPMFDWGTRSDSEIILQLRPLTSKLKDFQLDIHYPPLFFIFQSKHDRWGMLGWNSVSWKMAFQESRWRCHWSLHKKNAKKSKLLQNNMRPCCMSTIPSSQGCLRCGEIFFFSVVIFWFSAVFQQVRKGGAIWLTRRSGSLTRSPRIQKEVQLHPKNFFHLSAPQHLPSFPGRKSCSRSTSKLTFRHLVGWPGGWFFTHRCAAYIEPTQQNSERSKMQPLLNVVRLDFRSIGPVWQVSSYMCSEIRGRSHW